MPPVGHLCFWRLSIRGGHVITLVRCGIRRYRQNSPRYGHNSHVNGFVSRFKKFISMMRGEPVFIFLACHDEPGYSLNFCHQHRVGRMEKNMQRTQVVANWYRESDEFSTLVNYRILRAGHIRAADNFHVRRQSVAGHELILSQW